MPHAAATTYPTDDLTVKAHPRGTTGMAQCIELPPKPRGDSAKYVEGARIALAHNITGLTPMPGLTFLERT